MSLSIGDLCLLFMRGLWAIWKSFISKLLFMMMPGALFGALRRRHFSGLIPGAVLAFALLAAVLDGPVGWNDPPQFWNRLAILIGGLAQALLVGANKRGFLDIPLDFRIVVGCLDRLLPAWGRPHSKRNRFGERMGQSMGIVWMAFFGTIVLIIILIAGGIRLWRNVKAVDRTPGARKQLLKAVGLTGYLIGVAVVIAFAAKNWGTAQTWFPWAAAGAILAGFAIWVWLEEGWPRLTADPAGRMQLWKATFLVVYLTMLIAATFYSVYGLWQAEPQLPMQVPPNGTELSRACGRSKTTDHGPGPEQACYRNGPHRHHRFRMQFH